MGPYVVFVTCVTLMFSSSVNVLLRCTAPFSCGSRVALLCSKPGICCWRLSGMFATVVPTALCPQLPFLPHICPLWKNCSGVPTAVTLDMHQQVLCTELCNNYLY